MPTSKAGAAYHGGKKGNFAACRNGLLSHFANPGERGDRKWRKMFGYERHSEKRKRGHPFNALDAKRSPADK